ncbi:MAG: cytochrome c3 family protein [Myxococcota bacterium]
MAPRVAVVALVLAACGAASPRIAPPPGAAPALPPSSNVARADYAGSAVCTPCHAELAARFERSPMHRMTRDAEATDIRAPFDGRTFRFGEPEETVRFEQRGAHRFMVVDTPGYPTATYRVTKVIGGHYREDFVGQRVREVAADPVPAGELREMILPATWHFRHGEWRYKGYSVQIPERLHLSLGPEWAKSCIFCHNTEPYLATVLDDLGRFERKTYQGSVPSNLFAADRRLDFQVTDAAALASTLRDELAFLGADLDPAASTTRLIGLTLVSTQERFGERQLVELGIGCEACHNGAKAHADDPRVGVDFAPRSPGFRVVGADGLPLGGVEAQNRVCGRCHSVLLSEYDHTWEGGHRHRVVPDDGLASVAADVGGSSINSSEARDFALGGCARALACTACHDPHAADERAALDALATPAGNVTCTPCHAALAGPDALRAHAHHDPTQAGGSCVACHMPDKNAGLDYELERYHRIGLPDDPMKVERDRPIECALCHRDATVASLVATMERWWPARRYDRQKLADLYGADLAVPALLTTLARGLPHERTTAVGALAGIDRTDPQRSAVIAALADAFADELPITRYFAREALGAIVGTLPPLDMSRPGPALRDAAKAWLATTPTLRRARRG